MTAFEKHITIGTAAVALLMLMVPPWHATANGVVFNLGYHFIGAGPQLGQIDFVRLVIQLIIVGVIAFGIAKFLPPKWRW